MKEPNCQSILIADDSADDILLLKRAFKEAGLQNLIREVQNGEETIDYLTHAGKFADPSQFPFPGLLLLDIKMPLKSGFEVLEWIRNDSACKGLRVIIMSSSNRQEDIERAYELKANSYLVKPLILEDLISLAEMIKTYWCELAESPCY